jgi:hypothetical protein
MSTRWVRKHCCADWPQLWHRLPLHMEGAPGSGQLVHAGKAGPAAIATAVSCGDDRVRCMIDAVPECAGLCSLVLLNVHIGGTVNVNAVW